MFELVWFDVLFKGCVDAKAFASIRFGLLYNRKNLFLYLIGVEFGYECLKIIIISFWCCWVRRCDGKWLSGLGLYFEERIEFLLYVLRRRRRRVMRWCYYWWW